MYHEPLIRCIYARFRLTNMERIQLSWVSDSSNIQKFALVPLNCLISVVQRHAVKTKAN